MVLNVEMNMYMDAKNYIDGLRVRIGRRYKRQYVHALIEKAGKCRFCDEDDPNVLSFVQTGGRWQLKESVASMAAHNAGWKKLNQAINISSVVCANHAKKIKGDPHYLDGLIEAVTIQKDRDQEERARLSQLKKEYSL